MHISSPCFHKPGLFYIPLIYIYIYIYMFPFRGLSTLAKELMAATRVMLTLQTNWALWCPRAQNLKKQELLHNALWFPSWHMSLKMAERLDPMSNLMLGRFQSQLKASCMSSHTDELGYNETTILSMTIYIVWLCFITYQPLWFI